MNQILPDGRWLCVDPGETTGWSMWKGNRLLGGGQTPLGEFGVEVHDQMAYERGLRRHPAMLGEGEQPWLAAGVDGDDNEGEIELVVCEKFALYPWVIYGPNGRPTHALDFEEFRTVQLIGGIKLTCTVFEREYHAQPAAIKERALAGGAKELFVRPLHENRHTNDSIMHGFFYYQVEIAGVNLGVPDQPEAPMHHPV